MDVQPYNDCGTGPWATLTASTTALVAPSPCPCGDQWVVEAADLRTGRVRAILMPIAADWQTILTGLGTGTLTFPTRSVSLRDIWPDLTSIFISRVDADGNYDCRYAAIPQKVTGKSTLQGGTVQVGLRPIEDYWWRRFLDTDRTYTNTQQTQIAASLTSYAVTDGIPLVGVAETSTVFRTRTYVGEERPFIGDQLEGLSQSEDGLEWTLVHTRTNGVWTTQVVFQDRAGADLDDVFRGDREGAEYGIDVDAANHATYVDGFGDTPTGTRIFENATDDGPYVRFDAAPSFGTVADAANVAEESEGYLMDNREPLATPSFAIVDPDVQIALGDTATFHINQGAVTFNGPARVGSISESIAEGKPWTRTLGLIPLGRASDTVLNQ